MKKLILLLCAALLLCGCSARFVPDESAFGEDWPDCEFTRLIPKPAFCAISSASLRDGVLYVRLSDASADGLREYAETLSDLGFDENKEITDEDYFGSPVYSFKATGHGCDIELASVLGEAGITMRRHENG